VRFEARLEVRADEENSGNQLCRNAVEGSSFVACSAGHQTAIAVVATSTRGIVPNTSGSNAVTPKRKLAICFVSAKAPPIPITIPAAAKIIPCRMIIPRTFPRSAPNAIPDTDFVSALLNRIGHQTIDSDRRQEKSYATEHAHQQHVKALP